MARRASDPEIRIILATAQAHGWKVEDTKQGWNVKSPDGGAMVTMHNTPSDHRAVKNIKALFKRNGLDLDAPLPKKPQPTIENELIGLTDLSPVVHTGIEGQSSMVYSTVQVADPPSTRPATFIAEQPLVKDGKYMPYKRKKTPVAASAIKWEDPPSTKRSKTGGRPGLMDKYRAAMVAHPGEWLVFSENTTSQRAYYYAKRYGKLGFEFIGRRQRENDTKSYKVWARYVGVGEASDS